jgi:hypothetical protein
VDSRGDIIKGQLLEIEDLVRHYIGLPALEESPNKENHTCDCDYCDDQCQCGCRD